jgi:hypothetical protein
MLGKWKKREWIVRRIKKIWKLNFIYIRLWWLQIKKLQQ